MKGLVKYLILPENRLILECCKGNATVEDSMNMKKSEISDKSYDPAFDIIVDFREFETIIDSTVKDLTSSFFFFLKELNLNCKIAILTSAPNQVVISVILRELSNQPGSAKIEVFSTMEAAARFLGIPVEDYGFINRKIEELSKAQA